MEINMAPLEGLTGYIFRNAYDKYFGGVDRYYSPFIHASVSQKMTSREYNDINPENNKVVLVPQLLTNNSEAFIATAKDIKTLGYEEVNLNLGCPSGTVVAKGRGSGFLAKLDELDRFLYDITTALDMKISIKTRIGKNSPDEFFEIVEIYKKYNFSEIIIHPRTRKDFYNNTPNMEMFRYAYENLKTSLCYNGDINSVSDFTKIAEDYKELSKVMIGRGFLYNPFLAEEIKCEFSKDKLRVREFHDEVFENYKRVMSGDKNALFKMKNIWEFMGKGFKDSDKYIKKIRKSESVTDYNRAVMALFSDLEIND